MEERNDGFPVGIQVRLKHGILMEALEKRGWNQRQAAEFLGISQASFGQLINMRRQPRHLPEKLMVKLYELTGKSPEELWPEEVFTPEFLVSPRVLRRIREVPVQLLAAWGIVPALPEGPDEAYEREELREVVSEALKALPPIQRKVLSAHYLEGQNLKEIGGIIGKSAERVRAISEKALNSLRKPWASNRRLRQIMRNTFRW